MPGAECLNSSILSPKRLPRTPIAHNYRVWEFGFTELPTILSYSSPSFWVTRLSREALQPRSSRHKWARLSAKRLKPSKPQGNGRAPRLQVRFGFRV